MSICQECINEKILRSQEAGLWDKWRNEAVFTYRMNHPIDKAERLEMLAYMLALPTDAVENLPLSMDQLQTIFYIYFGMTFLAGISFALEKIMLLGKLSKNKRMNNWMEQN